MTDTTTQTADSIADDVEKVIDILNRSLDGISLDAVIMGTASFLRLVIDDQPDRSERVELWQMVEDGMFPEDVV